MAGPLHTRVHRGALLDTLRIETNRNGAIKSPTPQSERPVMESTLNGMMDTSGIGQAWTTSRSSRTYTGGGITPQVIAQQPAGVNTDTGMIDAGVAMNARAANPSRGITPRSPLLTRR